MKLFAKLSILFASLLLTVNAFGGAGLGGSGFGKTKLLLQSFAYEQAVLTLDGVTNVPETDTTPILKIDADEYKDLLIETQLAKAENKTFVLPVDLADGSVRYFAVEVIGEPGEVPYFIRVEEVKAENGKIVE
jgi:hypothetical protein